MAIADEKEKVVHSQRVQYLDPFASFDPFRPPLLELSEVGKLIQQRYQRECGHVLYLPSIKLPQKVPPTAQTLGGFHWQPKFRPSSPNFDHDHDSGFGS